MFRKIQKNSRNSFHPDDTRWDEESRRGPTRSQGVLVACPPPGRATWPPGRWGPPPDFPLRLYLPYVPKLHGKKPFLDSYLCSAVVAISISGGARRTYPGNLSEEEDHPRGLFVAITASWMMCQ